MVAVGVLLLIVAAYWIIIGVLASTRRLPGNKYIGLRTAEVRKSQETWQLAHAVAGPMWIVSGVAFAFAGIIAVRAFGWMWLLVLIAALVGVILISVGSNLGARAAYLDATNRAQEDSGCGDGGCSCGSGHGGGNGSGNGSGSGGTCSPIAEVDLTAVRHAAEASDSQ